MLLDDLLAQKIRDPTLDLGGGGSGRDGGGVGGSGGGDGGGRGGDGGGGGDRMVAVVRRLVELDGMDQ